MTLDKYIEILQGIRKEEGGEIEISRISQGRDLKPCPKVVVFNSPQYGKRIKQIKMLLIR